MKVRRNLFGKQRSFQNARVQQEMEQKKRELGEQQRRKGGDGLKESSKESLKDVKDASPSQQEQSKYKTEDEKATIVFPASPTKSVRQSHVSSWVTTAQQVLPSLALSKASPENKALRSRSPRVQVKSSAGKHQDVSKWVAYQRVRAGRRPGIHQVNSGKEWRRSRFASRESRKQAEKSFDLFKDQNQCSFFDSIGTNKAKGEGPLDFLLADGDNNEEAKVTEVWGDYTDGLEVIRPQEWEASETFGDGGALSCSGDWNEQNSAWSLSSKREGSAWQAGDGGDILDNLP